ncbi:MAG: beta-ketoacyl-ACP synthase III [Actinomycetes bacterium]
MTTSTPTPPTHTLLQPKGAQYARILSVGAYRPERVITNEEVCQHIDSSDQWIRERSGIVTRRWAAKDETVVDMSEAAAAEAIERAGLTGSDIDAVIVATISHPYQTPAAGPLLANRLGATPAAAFDISAACAGFCHAVSLAHDMVRGGSAGNVLVVGVEKLSDWTDIHDRSTAFIFGDGAGAVVIGPSDFPGIGPTLWGSDGAAWDVITQKHSWIDVRDHTTEWPALRMAGQSVFRWAVWQMAPIARKTLEASGIEPEELDVFIPHQANMRIIDSMIKQLGLPENVKVARDIAETGNTSAASIPLAMQRMLDDGTAKSGDLALLIGFGAGLAYASQVVVLP